MDIKRKKELLEEYKNRKPEKGIISYKCIATGESFLGISNDTKADFNSITMKLSTGYHPNKRLLKLWQEYGKDSFELSVLKILKYEDPNENHLEKLENLRDECLNTDKKSKKIWK